MHALNNASASKHTAGPGQRAGRGRVWYPSGELGFRSVMRWARGDHRQRAAVSAECGRVHRGRRRGWWHRGGSRAGGCCTRASTNRGMQRKGALRTARAQGGACAPWGRRPAAARGAGVVPRPTRAAPRCATCHYGSWMEGTEDQEPSAIWAQGVKAPVTLFTQARQ